MPWYLVRKLRNTGNANVRFVFLLIFYICFCLLLYFFLTLLLLSACRPTENLSNWESCWTIQTWRCVILYWVSKRFSVPLPFTRHRHRYFSAVAGKSCAQQLPRLLLTCSRPSVRNIVLSIEEILGPTSIHSSLPQVLLNSCRQIMYVVYRT